MLVDKKGVLCIVIMETGYSRFKLLDKNYKISLGRLPRKSKIRYKRHKKRIKYYDYVLLQYDYNTYKKGTIIKKYTSIQKKKIKKTIFDFKEQSDVFLY